MMNILDEIAAQRFNPRAFTEWKEYRRKLTDTVIAGTPEGCTLAVYGAGRCNDIDLTCLAEHFSEVTLLDFDKEAMEKALEQYGLQESDNIRTHCFDFVGISENDYNDLACQMCEVLDHTESLTSKSGFIHFAEREMRPVIETFYSEHEALVYRAPRYDAVLAAGLHSQLNQTAASMWRVLCAQKEIELDPLRDPVSGMIHAWSYPIIVRFNQLLFYSAKSKVFIAYEQSIDGRRGEVQGAMQLKDDLNRRMRQGQIELLQRHQAVWPQNKANSMVFEMAIDEFAVKG